MENTFAQNIANEEVALLSAGRFDGQIVVIESETGLREACKDLLSQPIIGFDTETRPTFRPGALNKVALLQLSAPERCYLFRLCRIPFDRMILRVLESKTTLKIGAGVDGDIRALQQLRRFRANGFVDLQHMVHQWGIAEKSVRKMAGIILGLRISKAQRLSNWEAATLTPAQQMYAATDAWICTEIYNRLLVTEKKPINTP